MNQSVKKSNSPYYKPTGCLGEINRKTFYFKKDHGQLQRTVGRIQVSCWEKMRTGRSRWLNQKPRKEVKGL